MRMLKAVLFLSFLFPLALWAEEDFVDDDVLDEWSESDAMEDAWTSYSFLNAEDMEFPENVHYTLEEVLDRVLSVNRRVLAAADSVRQSELSLASAEGRFALKSKPHMKGGFAGGGPAGANPAAGAGYDFTKRFARGTELVVQPSFYVTQGVYRDHNRIVKGARQYEANVNAVLSQPLLRGLSKEYNLHGVLKQEYGLRTTLRQQHTQEVELTVLAVSTVYRVLRAEQSLEFKRRAYESLEKAAKSARMKEKIGIADAMDVYRADLELTQADQNLALARESVQEALDSLKDLMELPLDTDLSVEAPLVLPDLELDEPEAVGRALEMRVEIEQADDALEEAMRGVRVADHKLWPELNWVGNYSMHGKDQVFTRAWSHLNTNRWGIGFSASGSYDRAALKRGAEGARLSKAHVERAKLDVEQRIAIEVKRAFRNLANAQKKIEVQEDRVQKAEGKRKLAELKFNRGLANNFDVIQAEKETLSSREALAGARIDYIVGSYRLRRALGTLVEKPNVW